MNTEYKILNREEVAEKLKNIKVGENNVLPMKAFSFVVINPDYDPDSFSQEIEDSEEEINVVEKFLEEIHKDGFDFVWNNTLGTIKTNSDVWKKNHTKICKAKLLTNKLIAQCVAHEDGVRDYYSEEMVDRIMNIEDVIDFW